MWWRTAVLYEVYVRSFQDGNGDGVGDLEGVIERLDHLAGGPDSLGVDGLWLSPFYPSPMADFGYDVSDYCGVHPLFGDLATFDRLIAEAHRRGLRVMIDFVPNHTSDRHPWFEASRRSRHDPKRDWYIWRDGKPDGSPPNNWTSTFGGSSWTWDERTGQYYYHYFLKEQPDLNWRNPEVVKAMHEAMRFWLRRGVDGFRVDAIHVVMEDEALQDNPPRTTPSLHPKGGPEFESQLHVHDVDHDDTQEVVRGLRRTVDAFDHRVLLGEVYLDNLERWARYYGDGGNAFHLCFNFNLLLARWDAPTLRAAVEDALRVLPEGAVPAVVLGSHDASRVATRHGKVRVRAAALLLLTLPGTPVLYCGEEIGMEDVPVPPERRRDPATLEGGRTRDPERAPMRWSAQRSAGPYAGFSPAEPWLPIGRIGPGDTVEEQRADPSSVFNFYRRLLAFRRASPALTQGHYVARPDTPSTCYAFERRSGAERKLIALNAGPGEVRMPVSSGTLVFGTREDRVGEHVSSTLVLAADEAAIVELSGLPSHEAVPQLEA